MASNVNRVNQNNNYSTGKPKVEREYSALKMGASYVGTGDMGYLIPAHVHELLPSQQINLNQSVGIQFNPFVSNLFHEINGEMLGYFVPIRIIWDLWEQFITGGIDGTDATEHPKMSLSDLWTATGASDPERSLLHTLADYFDMPINYDFNAEDPNARKPSRFLWWAYNKIYNDHIRIPDIETTLIDEDNNDLLRGNWDHDYFTRCRVYQQRGVVPEVPISEELQVLSHEIQGGSYDASHVWTEDNTISLSSPDYSSKHSANSHGNEDGIADTITGNDQLRVMPHTLDALGMNMNDFLISLGIMRYQINNAKIDPRYVDQLWARFGIYPEDARLQRPEYLGSRYFKVGVDTVTNTSGAGTEPQGHITSQAWASGDGLNFNYKATEHGLLFTMFIVRPKAVYEGGLDARWVKETRFDYATPELANLPDVEVKRSELMYTGDDGTSDDVTFGWQGIYEPYRTLQNKVRGLLRPSQAAGLGSMTLARYWDPAGAAPALNKAFLGCDPDQARILQYTDEPAFMFVIRNDVQTAIPIPFQSEPGDLSFM